MGMIVRLAPTGEARFPMPKFRVALPLGLLGALCALIVGTGSGGAATQSKCGSELLNDYVADGRIDRTYPVHCYHEALARIPADLDVYGSARQDLTRALLGVTAIKPGGGGGGGSSSGGSAPPVGPNTPVPSQTSTTPSKKDEGFLNTLAHKLGPGNASSIPLPLLILAGVGLLLVAAAGASYTARWVQARRAHPHPATSPPAPRRK